MLPQLYMVSRTGAAETITSHYLFALGIYRFFYILNWIYRYYMENFLDWISIVSGVIQTILYCDFFYLYITKGKKIDVWNLNNMFCFSTSWRTNSYAPDCLKKETFRIINLLFRPPFILFLGELICSS